MRLLSYNVDIRGDDMNRYEIWDINRFVEYGVQNSALGIKTNDIKENFNKLANGFNFVVAILNNDNLEYICYSVMYFNNKVLGND